MNSKKLLILLCLLIISFIYANDSAGQQLISIVPQPVRLERSEGEFILRSDTEISVNTDIEKLGRQLAAKLQPATGFYLNVVSKEISGQSRNSRIILHLDASMKELPSEGYRLKVTTSQISITATKPAGIFYGVQTLLQLLPAEIYREAVLPGVKYTVPCVAIEDYPRFEWRGMHLDVGRYFLPKEFIKKYIDLLAMHKMNRFHWHLTEDQGWRLEIKKFPKLTEVGAWRKESLVGHYTDQPRRYDGIRHGGFYTQDDVREIVDYARQRFVTVIPEIEMPGHSLAAIASYPELGNTGKQLEVGKLWGVNQNILNANESTILFYQDVLAEVLELFPSEFIHIGGDEAPKGQWENSLEAQARIKELGLKDEDELQSYFIKRMDTFLTGKGRRLVGWDEILEGGLAPGATVMSWRGERGGIAAAMAGHDVVMAPSSYTYFDYYQDQVTENEPLAISRSKVLLLEKVYGYNPVPKDLTRDKVKHILGAQGQLWTEYVPTPKKAEYMAFPRVCALAEVVWTPNEKKDYDGFIERLRVHLKRLDMLDVNYRKLDGGD